MSKTQHQNTFSLYAGATKEVNSPTAHKGIWQSAGATKSWLHSGRLQKSFAEMKKSLDAKSFAIQMIRESLRDDSRTWIGETKKSNPNERVWFQQMLIPCCTTVLFLSTFFDFSSTAFEISTFLYSSVRRLTLVVLDSSLKIEQFLHNMVTSLNYCRVEQNNHSFLANWPDWALNSKHLLRPEADLSVHLFLSCTTSRRPPRLPSFSHFVSQCLPYLTPNACALSLWQSQRQWVYRMVRLPPNLDCTLLPSRSLLL